MNFKMVVPVMILAALSSSCKKKTKSEPIPATVTFKTSYTIESEGLYPESVDYDNKNNRFVLSSFNKGTISTLSVSGELKTFISDKKLITGTGVFTDEVRNRLIVLGSDVGASEKSTNAGKNAGSVAYAAVYDLTNGTFIKEIDLKPLSPGAGAFPNDIAVDEAGNIYITDSFFPAIYKIDGNYKASVYASDDKFKPAPGAFGINGIVYSNDGYFLVTKTDNAKLFKVSLKNPSDIKEVSGITVQAPDGLEWTKNNELVIIENGLAGGIAYKFASKDNWATANKTAEKNIGKDNFPTSATLASNGKVFVLAITKLGIFLTGDKKQSSFGLEQLDF